MDRATREHVRRQIDAAARKREGLRPAKVRRTALQPNMDPGRRWTDGQVVEVLRQCARELGIRYNELTMARYRSWRDQDKMRGPSAPALTKRLPKLTSLPKGMA